jgi:hypothetical protein
LRHRRKDGAGERRSECRELLGLTYRQDEEAECGLESSVGRGSTGPIGGDMEGVGKCLDVVDLDGGQAGVVHVLGGREVQECHYIGMGAAPPRLLLHHIFFFKPST